MHRRSFSLTRTLAHAAAIALALVVTAPAASAQLMRASATQVVRTGDLAFGSDAAYDPVNDVYLVVIAKEASDRNLSTLVGVFVSPAGGVVSSVIIHTGNVNLPRVVHLSNMGVPDAFLVTWADFPADSIHARTLRYPGVLGGPFVTLGGGYGGQEVAYSPSSRTAGTVWTNDAAPRTTHFSRLPLPFATVSTVTPLSSGNSAQAFPLWNSLTEIAWHPTRDEFGILYVREGTPRALRFARMSPGGVVLDDRQVATTAPVPLAVQLAFSPATGNYVAYWADGVTGRITGTELSSDGTVLATGELPSSIVGGQLGMSLAYNPVSGTFLLIGFGQVTVAHEQIRGIELNRFGAPQGSPIEVTGAPLNGNFYAPRVAGRGIAAEWLIASEAAGGTHYAQIMSTFTTGGGSELRLNGCSGADPFAAVGGGVCVGGGWQPNPGSTPPPPSPPPPSTGGCSTPDPFAALGGGTCYDGGWLPPGMTPPAGGSTPPPQPPPSTPPPSGGICSSPDPFAALGGGTCHNGGWLPPGMTPPAGGSTPPPPSSPPPTSPPPPSPSGTCTTPDPFTALGGGTCYNGGWLPPGMTPPAQGSTPPPPSPPPPATPAGCTTPDPFSGIPNLIGECRNGGWVPLNRSDVERQP